MFKIKQKTILDSNYNIIRLEEYCDDKLIYWDKRTYDYSNKLLTIENDDLIKKYESYPHSYEKITYNSEDNTTIIYIQPKTSIRYINMNLRMEDGNFFVAD